jgi:dTDP-4-amino-4,6-dideoxygalactose transaminase
MRPASFSNSPALACLGGDPRFKEPLHVGRPNIGNRQEILRRIEQILDSRWLSNNGPLVREFESKLENYLQVKHCIAICNGTVALELATRALDFKGEVIVPSYTFIATPHALQWQGIRPVFADINPSTHNLDPSAVRKRITKRTTGIIGVHLWGRICPVEELQAIADEHGLRLMFDASHAFGCSRAGRMIGNFGECEVFSFHATKFLNAFEGGAITTNNDDLAARIRLMKNFGFHGYDNVIYLGTNGKMTEVCAAMGITGLEAIGEFIATNQANYEAYRKGVADIPGIEIMSYPKGDTYNYQYVIAEVSPQCALSRDELVAVLHCENVLARKYFWPGCHHMKPYRELYPEEDQFLTQTNKLSPRVIVLPTGTAVSPKEIAVVCDIIRTACLQAEMVREGLKSAIGSENSAPAMPSHSSP